MDSRQISERLKAEQSELKLQLAQYRDDLAKLAATPTLPSNQNAAGLTTGPAKPNP